MKGLLLQVVPLVLLIGGPSGGSDAQPLDDCGGLTPEQIHLSMKDTSTYYVTWVTQNKAIAVNFVTYASLASSSHEVRSKQTEFSAGRKTNRTIYVHRATLEDLKPNTTYSYTVGDSLCKSQLQAFKTLPEDGVGWKVAIYGDMGLEDGTSRPALISEAEKGAFDMVIHAGDFAYDLHDDEGRVGDQFMNRIADISSRMPYMTCPGNHEHTGNFTHYTNRFTMPENTPGDMFYSFNIGPIHFVSVSTEHFYTMEYGTDRANVQYDWLIRDLEEANKEENRKVRPWIIMFGHRPMYCSSNLAFRECLREYDPIRVGLPSIGIQGLEEVLAKYHVDLFFSGHEHTYERMVPIYNHTVQHWDPAPGVTDATKDYYLNPNGPVHFIAGAAGSKEKADDFGLWPNWLGYRTSAFGYTTMSVLNKTHLEFTQTAVPNANHNDSRIIDKWMIAKTKTVDWSDLSSSAYKHPESFMLILLSITIVVQLF